MEFKKSSPFWTVFVLALVTSRVHSLPNLSQEPLLQDNVSDQSELRTNDQSEKPWAVGFELGPTYGTASIRWANGNYSHVVKIDGDQKYHDAMRFFSSKEAVHPHKPYQQFGDEWVDLPRQLYRAARKAIGLPATKEVGALAAMLKDLRTATQWHLEDDVERAVVVRPNLNAFYEDDMFDALEYADLPYVRICRFSVYNITTAEHARESKWTDCAVPVSHFAAIAGEGIGMCSNYSDDVACRTEWRNRTPEITVVIDWAKEYLQITFRTSQAPYLLWGESEYRWDSIRFDLGFGEIPDEDEDEGVVDEWVTKLNDYLVKSLDRARSGWRDIDHILFIGDAMRMKDNQESGIFIYWFVDAVLEDLGQKKEPEYHWDCDRDALKKYKSCGDQDPAFTGANGAAEMAWRWERGLWRCPENEKEEGTCGDES